MSTRSRRSNSKQTPTLRLTRDDDGPSGAHATGVQVAPTFRTTRGNRARTRLVAGTVDLPATPDEDSSGIGAVIGRIGPDDFLRGLESTLGRMQQRLDDLKRDADDVFKFPVPPDRGDDTPRPRAA